MIYWTESWRWKRVNPYRSEGVRGASLDDLLDRIVEVGNVSIHIEVRVYAETLSEAAAQLAAAVDVIPAHEAPTPPVPAPPAPPEPAPTPEPPPAPPEPLAAA